MDQRTGEAPGRASRPSQGCGQGGIRTAAETEGGSAPQEQLRARTLVGRSEGLEPASLCLSELTLRAPFEDRRPQTGGVGIESKLTRTGTRQMKEREGLD